MTGDPGLPELIDAQIRANGPMSIASYMALCLTHPRRGYYKQDDPLGAGGDFITAPEISQMFGELIGFFFVNLWQQKGEPRSFTLLELGPGRGTLMQDALRVATRAPGFGDALHLQLYETNEDLKRQQAARLRQYHPYWAEEIDAVGDGPLLVVANEFFDAMPIRQFVRGTAGWHERLVGLRDGKRIFGLSPTPIPDGAVPETLRGAGPGAVYEMSLAARDVMQRLGQAVARLGGAILAIDYGHGETQAGETLQAVRRHAYADPLDAPGQADLSAHVDFGALATAATDAGLIAQPLATQGDFLRRLGIGERARMLADANPGEAATIAAALERLTGAEQMGRLFKVFCATSPGLVPAGFS
ncbi:class I SAM-dependent methyltransferase [Devosia sp.]|uniref:class I SAM-dependent methyltransferase n=1 Tax=Devosia sp. TaxID=1871048 RepID=UPI002F258930